MSLRFLSLVVILALACGCAPKLKLFSDSGDPLQEFVLEGRAQGKVLVLPIQGFIWDEPREGLLVSRPSVVQEVVSQLRLAEKDKEVGAVVLKIDSPGGTTTGSDVLYHEIRAFRERSKKKVVACMMGLAASGGYYVALPADRIVASPTTITGSVGVVFFRPKVVGLMDMIGVEVEVSKSGRNKDMGSPFRPSTEEELGIMNSIIERFAGRFLDLVKEHRRIQGPALDQVSTARVFTADQALGLGLVDGIGYLDQVLDQAKDLAGLPEDARVVVYRRTEYPNDTAYNTLSQAAPAKPAVVDLGA
ncbi:MAG: signal peptide peptidase SppA, partial [Desulfovibrionaceae bacterium]|nr:signal peptide peptidase SppA [Desulfovibrionaceae bacterium]